MQQAQMGLIHAGKPKATLLETQAVRRCLGPVFSRRNSVATIAARSFGGRAVDDLRELLDCKMILISCPDDEVEVLTESLVKTGLPIAGIRFLLWDCRRSSLECPTLQNAGALVASVSFFGSPPLVILEGDESVARIARHLLSEDDLEPILVAPTHKSRIVETVLNLESSIDSAVSDSLKHFTNAGLKPIDATRYVRERISTELRKLQRPRSS